MRYDTYTIDNGLSQNMVVAICEDQQGFMWFGTKDGLNRFDGHSFVIYRNNPDNPHSLSDNEVSAIYEDKAQNLWIGTNPGRLNYFDRKTSRFYVLPDIDINLTVSRSRNIIDIKEDQNGDIWVASYNALSRIIIKDKKIGLHPDAKGIKGQYKVETFLKARRNGTDIIGVNEFTMSSNGLLYVIMGDGLYRSEKKITESISPHFIKVLDKKGNSITEDKKGIIWFTSAEGLFRYDPKSSSLTAFKDPRLERPSYNKLPYRGTENFGLLNGRPIKGDSITYL